METDGFTALAPYERMSPGTRKLRDFYALKPDAPIYQQEFGFYVMDKWKEQGYIHQDVTESDLRELFGFDNPGKYYLRNLGGCEAAFSPAFEEYVIQDTGEYEIAQDFAGRQVKFFKNRRNGFMPEYMDHPVKDQKTWEERCKWRMNPASPERHAGVLETVAEAKTAAAEGQVLSQYIVGGYMYLRSLMGPMEIMYLLYDNPELIHTCMETWLALADFIVAEHQKHVTLDEILFDEDICYKQGLLISENMVREFLFPYYQQLLTNAKRRQLDKSRTLHLYLGTDGFCDNAIDLYSEIGIDYLAPFEVAAGCDVVRTAKEYPDLLISGGFDKRILAGSMEGIDREIERIMPVMKKRGGYFPTCDHGVPEEVSFENYMHYRKRMLEYAN